MQEKNVLLHTIVFFVNELSCQSLSNKAILLYTLHICNKNICNKKKVTIYLKYTCMLVLGSKN